MSYQNKKLNLVFDDKKDNFNLISMEKSPNKDIKIDFQPKNINLISKNNINPKDKLVSNDLLNTKNEDDLNLSNMNIEKTQKFIHNADILFTEEDEEKEDNKENEFNDFNKKDNSININNNNEINKNIQINDLKDSMSISIDESKRIELANNLFEQSLTSSIKSNLSSEGNLSLVSNKRKEVADKLFESVSDLSSKKISLNETFKSNKSDMSHVINNLSGSNIGLNINAIANKYANLDKVINENDAESNIIIQKENNTIKNSVNNYNTIEDQNIDEISFNKNLIDIQRLGNEPNNINNNLKNINLNSSLKNQKENNLISSFKKIDLVNNSKEINNNNNKNNYVDNESKKNALKYNVNDNEDNNSEISFTNVMDDITINKVNVKEKKDIIDESNQKNKENESKFNKISPIKKSLAEILKQKRDKVKNEEKKIGMIEKDDTDRETSNDILNNKIRLNTNENDESSFINNKNNKIIFDEQEYNIISNKKGSNNNKKIQLINEGNESMNNRESLNTKDKLIYRKNKNELISEKNVIELGKGKNNLLNENENNKFVKIKKRKKIESEMDSKIEEDDLNESKNSNKIIKNINNIKLIYFNNKNINDEKRFKDYLGKNKMYFNDNIYNEKENENQIKAIKENSYFENNYFNKETIINYIYKNKNKLKIDFPIYYDIAKKTYEKNKDNFYLLFQFITNKDKDKLFKYYKTIHNYNISNYHISPYINDIKDACKSIKLENIKNIDYIRYTIDENEGDTFYKCFMFNIVEKYIIDKNKDNLFILIFDIFKLYDLSPSIFYTNKNNISINNTLILFSIIRDYIHLNLWEKAYDLFISLYSQIDDILALYIKYNIFIFLSKINSQYDEKNKFDKYPFYLDEYKKILINYNEPSLLVFQIIPFIFGVNLEILFYENKNEDNLILKNLSFALPKNLDKSNLESIYIIYYNNCYHIGYPKKYFIKNNNILTGLKDNINKISLIHYIKKDKIFCDICQSECDTIEIIDDINKRICQECLYSEIDEYLKKRITYINEDCKSNYINYSYYLRPIELMLKEPISIKDNIENNSIIIKNIDYYLLFNTTFSERISELFQKDIKVKSIQIKNGSINNEINNDIDNQNENCSICKKSTDILDSECGCKFCGDCIYEILENITNKQIILNGYEKMKLYNNDDNKCPICDQKLNSQYLALLLEGKGRDFEMEYNEAKIRMKNYIKTICFLCEKKFENHKSLEVEHNSKKEFFSLKVMINKHCINDTKKIIDNFNSEKEKEIDYCDSNHVVCLSCFKKNKTVKIKEIDNIQYKVFICNICGIRHYISVKEWDKWNKHEVCCKCNIF